MAIHQGPLFLSGRYKMPLDLSVIIGSYKRFEALELCLEDLAEQKTTKSFEVILVLQAFPEGEAERIRAKYGDRLTLQIAEFDHGIGIAGSRNVGLKMSQAEVIAIVDDDCRMPPTWVEGMLSYYDDPKIGGVGGFVGHPGHFNPFRNTMYRLLGLTASRYRIDWGGFNQGAAPHPEEDQPAEWLSGGNMSYRRQAVLDVGGFDETLGNVWFDDVDIGHRVASAGWRLISTNRMAVDHFPNNLNRQPLHIQMLDRERARVLVVWKAIGNKPLWKVRYAARLLLYAGAMGVVGLSKLDPRIPINAIRGGLRGLRELPKTRAESAAGLRRQS